MTDEELKNLNLAYSRLFHTTDGKRVLEDLRRFCCFENSSVCESDPNPYQTFFVEGKRRVFLRIWTKLNEKDKQWTDNLELRQSEQNQQDNRKQKPSLNILQRFNSFWKRSRGLE